MTPSEYQKLAARTIACKTPLDMGRHGALGLVAELQEFVEIRNDYNSGVDDDGRYEFGDIWWMIAEICTAYGINMDDLKYRLEFGFANLAPIRKCAGNIAGIFQKTYQGHPVPVDNLKYFLKWLTVSLGDYGYSSCGFDLEEIWKMNIEKLQRRYPDGFEVEKSLHRNEEDI